jgi:mRNA-degrading endonuclease RelE of RelBE toxin-antitoxin system
MGFDVKFSPDADRQLGKLRAVDRSRILAEIRTHLLDQADRPSRKRKELHENPLARWELRIDDWRVFYNAFTETGQVIVTAIGLKDRTRLLIEGKEFQIENRDT